MTNSVCCDIFILHRTGREVLHFLSRSVEDLGDLLHLSHVWIMVTHVSSTELTVSLSVSPLRRNFSVAILYFPILHIPFYFGASVPYLSSEVTNEKAESQFNFIFLLSFLLLLQKLVCGLNLKLNSPRSLSLACVGEQGGEGSRAAL